jgi:hypothetical protein
MRKKKEPTKKEFNPAEFNLEKVTGGYWGYGGGYGGWGGGYGGWGGGYSSYASWGGWGGGWSNW